MNVTNPTPSAEDEPKVLRCTIQGTHNRYQMKKVTRENEMYKYKSRVLTSTWDPSLYTVETQRRLLLEIQEHVLGAPEARVETSLHKPEHVLMKKEIETKLSGYKFQDQTKKREGRNLSFAETVDKLLACNLLCYYCNTQCHVFYERVREMSQWSLDRIDNGLCHSVDNVVVACLQCNLHRKNRNSNKFKETKAMKTVTRLEAAAEPEVAEAEGEHNTEISEPCKEPPPQRPPPRFVKANRF